MNKNYYDILQVNRNASPEIIEKAYKTLAKKYHPDLQIEENKKQSEEILKEINEAYETLSNIEKKQAYDASLDEKEKEFSTTDISYPQTKNKDTTNTEQPLANSSRYKPQILHEQQLQQERQYQEQLQREQELAYQQQLEQARQKAYHDAYIQDLKNRGYKIRYKKSLKDYITSFVSLLATLLVLFLLWQIPFIRNIFVNMYLENEIIHIIVDIILNLF